MSTSIYIKPSAYPNRLFAQTGNSSPITGTTIEKTLVDGGVGSLTVPANSFQVGDSFLASLNGHITCVNSETLRIRVKSGAILLSDSGLISMPQCTNKHWDLNIHFTIRTIGAPTVASIMASGALTYSKDASNIFEGADFSNLNNTTFDTTISNTLDITAQWGSNNAGNTIYTENFTLQRTY